VIQIPRRPVVQLYQLVSGRRFLSRLDELNETQWLGRQALLDLQRKKLHNLLSYAYDHVPYYRRALEQVGF
jgi:phenylacetate-coenzyme A ligase PaaK-like adenylate-forming protein